MIRIEERVVAIYSDLSYRVSTDPTQVFRAKLDRIINHSRNVVMYSYHGMPRGIFTYIATRRGRITHQFP
jgi:hypothetical protein